MQTYASKARVEKDAAEGDERGQVPCLSTPDRVCRHVPGFQRSQKNKNDKSRE